MGCDMDDDLFGWFKPKKPKKIKKTGRQLKEEGIARVLDNESEEWKAEFHNRFGKLPIGWVGTSEKFKFLCRDNGIKEPHHWNCWSSGWNTLARHGRIVRTGEREYPTSASRHSNLNDIWRKTE